MVSSRLGIFLNNSSYRSGDTGSELDSNDVGEVMKGNIHRNSNKLDIESDFGQ